MKSRSIILNPTLSDLAARIVAIVAVWVARELTRLSQSRSLSCAVANDRRNPIDIFAGEAGIDRQAYDPLCDQSSIRESGGLSAAAPGIDGKI